MLTAPARRVLSIRESALADRDLALVAECDLQLASWGIDPADETSDPVTVTEPAPEARPARARVRTRVGR